MPRERAIARPADVALTEDARPTEVTPAVPAEVTVTETPAEAETTTFRPRVETEADTRYVTGHHRVVGKTKRRRVAKWPIACLVLVALVGLAWLGFTWAESESNSRAEAQAASCADGDSTLRIVVTPSAKQAVDAAAQRWNDQKKVVHAHCIRVEVQATPSQQVLDALAGNAGLDTIGGLPAAWIAESAYWVDALTSNKPEIIGSPAESVASARSAEYRYLGLSGQGVDDVQKRAAQSFRGFLLEPEQQAAFDVSH